MNPDDQAKSEQNRAAEPAPVPKEQNYPPEVIPRTPEPFQVQQPVDLDVQDTSTEAENPRQKYIPAVLLSFFLGSLGIDRFYLGKIGTGIVKLLTLGVLGIWSFIDFVLLVFGTLRAKQDPRPLGGYKKYGKAFKIAITILIILPFILLVVILVFASNDNNSRLIEAGIDVEKRNALAQTNASLAEYYYENNNYITDNEFAGFNRTISDEVQYQALPLNCDNEEIKCTGYEISVMLSDGNLETKTSAAQ